MGLDFLDVKFRIDKVFKVQVPMDELSSLVRGNDLIVGDLYEHILKKLNLCDTGRNDWRVNQYLWREMQQALHLATERPLDRIELGLPLDALFPRETRRAGWNALCDACPYRIGELDYSQFVRLTGFLLAVGVVAIEHLQIWQVPGAKWLWPLFGVIGVWMVGETYLKILSVFAPLRIHFPARMITVKDLCRSVLSANYADVCRDSAVVVDERCAVVWEQLVEILVQALGVEPAEVTFRSRVFRDLGAA